MPDGATDGTSPSDATDAGVDGDGAGPLPGCRPLNPDASACVSDASYPTAPSCTDGGVCWALPRPTGNGILAVWGASATDLWASGESATLLHGDGTYFTPIALPIPPFIDLHGIWGSAADDVWAVGDNAFFVHWNGATVQTGTVVDNGLISALSGVWGFAKNDVWAVGQGTNLFHYTGGDIDAGAASWTQVPVASDAGFLLLESIWGAAPDDVWVVGEDEQTLGGAVYRGNAARGFQPVAVPAGTPALHRVWGFAKNDVWFATQGAKVVHYDGSTFTTLTLSGSNTQVETVWGAAPDDVWAMGAGVPQHGSTSGFTPVGNEGFGRIYSLWGSCSSDVWAVGDDGALYRWDGRSWANRAGTPPGYLFFTGMWAGSASDVWAVGQQVLHFDGASWCPVAGTSGVGLQAVSGSAANNVWMVADSEHIFRYDGSMITKVPAAVDVSVPLMGVFASAPNDVFTVGAGGTILHYDGTSWSAMTSGVTAALHAIAGTSGSDVWVVGGAGTILHYDGATWTPRAAPGVTDDLDAVFALPGGEAYAGGFNARTSLHWRAGGWSTISVEFVEGIWASGPNDVWMANQQDPQHWDGTLWKTIASGARRAPKMVTGAGGVVWFGADQGILELR